MKERFKLYLILFLIVANTIIFYVLYQAHNSDLTVAFLDIGQGDSIFIEAPNGRQMLVDGGPNNSVLRELGKVMPFYDRSIDIVLATHPDQDHIAGLIPVMERYQVDLFVRTVTMASTSVYETLLQTVTDKKIKTEIITVPENIILGDGVEFNILFPDKDTTGWETNDSSIVGRLVYKQNSFLLTGDSPIWIEQYLVNKYGPLLKSDVLKVGHHGSKTSSSELFIKTVAPIYSIISAGLDNRYGHPAPNVIDVLNQFGGQILKTMGRGSVIFTSNGQDLKPNY